MIHKASADFWALYDALPDRVRALADKQFAILKADPHNHGLALKHMGHGIYSARIGIHYRALGELDGEVMFWFWIGSHAEYDRVISR